MPVIDAAQGAQPVDRGFVVELTGQHVAGVGGHHHQAATRQNRRGLIDQPLLRMGGMDFEKLTHRASSAAASGQSCQTGRSDLGSGGIEPRSCRLSPGPWKSDPRDAISPKRCAVAANSPY